MPPRRAKTATDILELHLNIEIDNGLGGDINDSRQFARQKQQSREPRRFEADGKESLAFWAALIEVRFE